MKMIDHNVVSSVWHPGERDIFLLYFLQLPVTLGESMISSFQAKQTGDNFTTNLSTRNIYFKFYKKATFCHQNNHHLDPMLSIYTATPDWSKQRK